LNVPSEVSFGPLEALLLFYRRDERLLAGGAGAHPKALDGSADRAGRYRSERGSRRRVGASDVEFFFNFSQGGKRVLLHESTETPQLTGAQKLRTTSVVRPPAAVDPPSISRHVSDRALLQAERSRDGTVGLVVGHHLLDRAHLLGA